MNLKLRKNRGLTLALMILAACMICLLVPTRSVSAKAKNGIYDFYNVPGVKLKIKNYKMKTYNLFGSYQKFNKKYWYSLARKKKRTFTISKKCRFYTSFRKGKTLNVKRCSYKFFVKRSKQWVNEGGKKRLTIPMRCTVKKGKVVKLYLPWIPYSERIKCRA